MWIAIECSVTVSIGEETKGVLRVILLVTGVSKATSEAAKPGVRGQQVIVRLWQCDSTDVAWKHQKVIVRQAAVDLGIEQGSRVDTIGIGIFIVEYFECFGVV